MKRSIKYYLIGLSALTIIVLNSFTSPVPAEPCIGAGCEHWKYLKEVSGPDFCPDGGSKEICWITNNSVDSCCCSSWHTECESLIEE
jgi:hypothetical protein